MSPAAAIPTATPADQAGDRLARADALARQSLALAMGVLRLAELQRRPTDMTQALAQVGRSLKLQGDLGSAAHYLKQALQWVGLVPGHDARVDLLCEMAELAATAAEALDDAAEDDPRTAEQQATLFDAAREHAVEAARCAAQATDAHWEYKALLRASDVLNRCGDHDDAAAIQGRAIALIGLALEPMQGHVSESDAMGVPPTNLLM